jgi:hypothetical protein
MVVNDGVVARVRRMNVGRGLFEEEDQDEEKNPVWEGEILARLDEYRFSAQDASEDPSW